MTLICVFTNIYMILFPNLFSKPLFMGPLFRLIGSEINLGYEIENAELLFCSF